MKFEIKKCKFFKDFVIIVLISLGILVGSEGILRIVFPEKVQNSTEKVQNLNVAYEFNEDFLVHLKPNISKIFTRSKENGGNITRWKTNKDSFRGANLKDDSRYRVIVYGDSNVQARFSGSTRTFTGQLDHYLRKRGIPDIEIINAGVIGFGPDQSLIRFAKEADKYRPNLVIFHVFADNDFGDIVRNRLFSLDTSGNLISTDHRKTIDAHLLDREREKYKSYISDLLIVRAVKKITAGFLSKEEKEENVVHQLQESVEAEYLVYKESRPRQFSHFEDHYDIDIALHPEQESSRKKIQLMNEVLKKANNFSHAKGIKFLVIIQPSVIDLTKDNTVLNYEYLQKYPNYKRTNLTGEVEKICAFHNIHCINLFDVFLENSPEDLYFMARDGHWNDQGQELAAKETALYIIQHSMIEKLIYHQMTDMLFIN